jgi:hypothetical protein
VTIDKEMNYSKKTKAAYSEHALIIIQHALSWTEELSLVDTPFWRDFQC